MTLSKVLRGRSRQRGAASLAVVMVLFFILAMVAAYTNRNLVFEQRTSANSYRGARALAAADAGVDWAIGMLNGGVIGNTCTAAGASNDFRTRYLRVEEDGAFTANTWPSTGASAIVQAQPSCSGVEGGGWQCSCPLGPPAMLNAANSEEPVFVVGFRREPAPNGVVALQVRACDTVRSGIVTESNVNTKGSCHVNDMIYDLEGGAHKAHLTVDAMAMLRVSVGLVSALPVVPSAALTVLGKIDQNAGTQLNAANPDPLTGLALRAGGTIGDPAADIRASGPAGSTAGASSPSEPDLNGLSADEFFRTTFGMPQATYMQQPAAVRIDCSSACSASTKLLPAIAAGPTRVIFVDGDLNLDTTTAIGSAATPTMVVVTKNVTVSQPIAFNGVLYVGGDLSWGVNGGLASGAVIVAGKYNGSGNAAFAYDRKIVQRINKFYGSFVRVPGGWITES